MIRLFFDIETIPGAEEHKDSHLEILRKRKANTDKNDNEIHETTSFDGTFGRICCIGIIKENAAGEIIQKEVFKGSEKEILAKFWQAAKGVTRFIGHNVWAFDMPFIVQRSVINGVKPLPISFRRYYKEPLFDTMLEWSFWNYDKDKNHKLDTLAKVLGLPSSKDEMDGSMVWKYYQDGKIEDICKYCMKDVELTRQIYYKMTFEDQAFGDDINF